MIHRHFPELRDNLPPMALSRVGQSSFKYDSTKATRELGIVYIYGPGNDGDGFY
jgi:hypothetical protein